jgi:hypothetical protein
MDLRTLALPGTVFRLHVTPRARADAITLGDDGVLRLRVTAAPEAGRANRAVLRLLAEALDVAPTRLTILRGLAGRDKLVRLD